jgi:RimJ/RimL family protein N-acetyltransferase
MGALPSCPTRLQSLTIVTDATPILVELPERLVGQHVVVRPYAESDAPAMWDAVEESREHLAPWMPWVGRYTAPRDALASIRRFQSRWITREDLTVGIFDHTGRRMIGGTGLHRIDWQIRRFEIGYWLRPSAEGHGYATEAVQLLTRLAFDSLAANRVEIRMEVENTRSRAIPDRLGFQLEGRLRRAAPGVDGQPRDIWLFSLLREEFDSLPWTHAN